SGAGRRARRGAAARRPPRRTFAGRRAGAPPPSRRSPPRRGRRGSGARWRFRLVGWGYAFRCPIAYPVRRRDRRPHARSVVVPTERSPQGAEVGGERPSFLVPRAVVRGAQDGRWMDRGEYQRRQIGVQQVPAAGSEREVRSDQGMRGSGPQECDGLRPDQGELLVEPRAAGGHLEASRLLVDAALAAHLKLEVLDDVRDVRLAAVDSELGERAVELAPGRADEWGSSAILAVACHLTDEHQSSAAQSLPEDRLSRPLPQVAATAAQRRLAQRFERPPLREERPCVVRPRLVHRTLAGYPPRQLDSRSAFPW